MSPNRLLILRSVLGSVAGFGVIAALTSLASSCSSEQDGPIGQTTAGLTVATNHSISGPAWLHETAVAAPTIPGTSNTRWVVATNNCQNPSTCNAATIPAWSYSNDITGATWNPNVMATGLDFGDPGVGSAGAFSPNGGWLGDPSLALVTDPTLSNNGNRVLFTSMGFDSGFNINKGGSDILVALSENGGQTWGNPHYVNLPGCGNGGSSNPNACGGVDSTFIRSDPDPPYSKARAI